MSYIKKFFIVVGLFLLSQISITIFTVMKLTSVANGFAKLSVGTTIFLIIVTLANIALLVYLARKLGFFKPSFDFLTLKNCGIIFGSFILARIIAVVGTSLLMDQGTELTANDATIQTIFSGENPLLIILLIAVSAPIMEEIVFRGAIIGFWLKKYPVVAIALSTISFGLIHGPTDLISFLIYALVGLIFSMVYYKTQRLEVSIGSHFLNNILGAIALALGLF
ncbi:CPBP family intramembrane glutamic endopeptidase [Enterococcus sp. LJL99]